MTDGKQDSPLISVVLTSFNHATNLQAAIDSVLQQSFQDLELIIIDDCSDDSSWEIIQNQNDRRITALKNERRQRGSYGINRAITDYAKGQYIAIHHSDDEFHPEKLEKQLDCFRSIPDVGMVFTAVEPIDSSGKRLTGLNPNAASAFCAVNRSRHEWLNQFFYSGNSLCHPSVMARKECYQSIGLYDRRMANLGDLYMWVRTCLNYEIHVLEEPLTRFRVHDNQTNTSAPNPANSIRMMSEWQIILERYLSIPSDELLLVFPDVDQYIKGGEFSVPYVIARLALEHHGQAHKIFGLTTLYELFASSEEAQKIETWHGFSYLELIELSAKADVYRTKYFHDLSSKFGTLRVAWHLAKQLRQRTRQLLR